ncbi:MAG TPA: sigma-70 family RNA polymerase sigma factor [Polyangia bacterium]
MLRATSGDETERDICLTALYQRWSNRVLRRARLILKDEDLAKDVLQEVFLRALRAGFTFRDDPQALSWLYRVTTNLCLNHRRNGARRGELAQALFGELQEAPGSAPDVVLTVRTLFDRTPEHLSDIAGYYYFHGMTHDEIAGATGLRRRTVCNRLQAFRTQAAGQLA